jgi:hypothetical protein
VDLYVLNRSLQRIGIVPEYETLVWTSRAWAHSEASLKCGDVAALPAEAAFLQRSDTDESMFITRRHATVKSRNYGQEITAKGATLLLARRVNWWTQNFKNVPIASAAATLVAAAQTTRNGIDRTIPGMSSTLVNLTSGAPNITKQVSWGQVADAVYELARELSIVFGVRYGATQLEAFLRSGVDRSADVVFSDEFIDVAEADVDIDSENHASLAVVGGTGEGPARIVTTVQRSGELAEMWVDAKDLSSTDLTPTEYLSALQRRGTEKLDEAPVTRSFEAKITQDRYRLRSDYALGDRVAYRAFGIEGTDIISEVVETFERGQTRVDIALGKTAPTIRALIRAQKGFTS